VSSNGATGDRTSELRAEIARLEKTLGRRPKLLVAKASLDDHGDGAEHIALAARDVGFEVVYESNGATPEQIVTSALEESVHVIALSMSGSSRLELIPRVVKRAQAAGIGDMPIVVSEDFERSAIASELVRLASALGAELPSERRNG
jgi:(2R)-ethylmalonyl-CoA mutase